MVKGNSQMIDLPTFDSVFDVDFGRYFIAFLRLCLQQTGCNGTMFSDKELPSTSISCFNGKKHTNQNDIKSYLNPRTKALFFCFITPTTYLECLKIKITFFH